MTAPEFFPPPLEAPPVAAPAGWGIDELLAAYAAWREASAAVTSAYSEWLDAPIAERRCRHAGFRAALDQEAAAATHYEVVADELRSSLWPGD